MNLSKPDIAAEHGARSRSADRGMTVAPPDPYRPLAMLSQYAGLSVRTLGTYLTDRLRPLPSYRVGGKILVRRSDFDAWMNQFRIAGKPVTVDALVNDVLQGLG